MPKSGKEFTSFYDTAKPWHNNHAHCIVPKTWLGYYISVTVDDEKLKETYRATLFGTGAHIVLDTKFIGKKLFVEKTEKKGSIKKKRE